MSDDLVEKVARVLAENDDHRVWHAWCSKARAALSAIEAAGFVIVPVHPTRDMSYAAPDNLDGVAVEDIYTAMLSARPRITGETT